MSHVRSGTRLSQRKFFYISGHAWCVRVIGPHVALLRVLQEIEMGSGSVALAAAKDAILKSLQERGNANAQWWSQSVLGALGGCGTWFRVALRQLSGMLVIVFARSELQDVRLIKFLWLVSNDIGVFPLWESMPLVATKHVYLSGHVICCVCHRGWRVCCPFARLSVGVSAHLPGRSAAPCSL
jgi:hypothetical protein